MSRYTFTSLSPQDLEELVRDLLQAEWNVPIEAFKTGRDSGIDLRYATGPDRTTIVQCKHYAASGYNKLISNLRNIELPKVMRLRPTRYVVATSEGLTPANKDEIVAAMRPFIRSVGDVLGAQDLEGLLSRHPLVEKANFKLWLTSTSVLERVIHNAEQCHTDFEVERIRRKLPLFVQNKAFPRANSLLDESRVVVISGPPGIGKTTVAEMLLYAHLDRDYQPVVIEGDIADGRKFFRATAKQIFYYDDFLGQTFLGDRKEYLGRNEDAGIVDFAEMVQRSGHSRFILTTREHILRNALQLSEKFAHSPLFQHRCVIELGDYSYAEKARILYNHLYFSDLSQPYRDAVLENRFFLEIIQNKNFNPRLIEWLSMHTRVRNVLPQRYQSYISELLKSPQAIWSYAFHNQISSPARQVLLALYTAGEWIEISDLEPPFIALRRHLAAKYNDRAAPGDFRKALQELDGAFLSYSTNHASFLNPPIREFVASVIACDRDTAEDLLASAIRFKQVVALWKLAQAHSESALATVLIAEQDLLFEVLGRLLRGPSVRWEEWRNGSRRGHYIDIGVEGRIGFLIGVATAHQSNRFAQFSVKSSERLAASWDQHVPAFLAVCHLFATIAENTWFFSHGGGRALYRTLLDSLMNELRYARADDWAGLIEFKKTAVDLTQTEENYFTDALGLYCSSGVKDEISDCTTLDEMSGLIDSLSILLKKYGLDVGSAIQKLNEEIKERLEDDGEDEDPGVYDDYQRGQARRIASQEMISDDDVSQMFSTLRNSSLS